MFSSIRKAQILIPFFNQRLSNYAELARLDLITFRNEMIAAIVAAAVGVATLLLLLGFVCVAVIITEWDTPNRIRAAWIIVVVWGLITGVCACVARILMKGSSPFANIGSEISLDLAVIKRPQPRLMTESLTELLEKMRASRAALRHQLDQITARPARGTQLTRRALTSKGLNIAVAVVFAVAILLTRRRR
jgi:amino acid transporter